ncbi:MAG: hypothetical protein V3W34_19600 [Phycisphaerae bacterium]
MPDHSPYQKKLIGRYYDRRHEILLTRLQEIVTELFLADSAVGTKRLWSRANQAMEALKVPQKLRDHIVVQADAEVLARNIRDWLKAVKKNAGKTPGE